MAGKKLGGIMYIRRMVVTRNMRSFFISAWSGFKAVQQVHPVWFLMLQSRPLPKAENGHNMLLYIDKG